MRKQISNYGGPVRSQDFQGGKEETKMSMRFSYNSVVLNLNERYQCEPTKCSSLKGNICFALVGVAHHLQTST